MFVDGRNRYWYAGFVNYTQNPREIIMVNIKDEETAIENYKRHIEMIDNKQVKALLARIILDEENHIKILTNLL
jgi:bacterioferritin